MRLLFLVLFVLLGLIQYPLWLGKGGWFKVWDLQRQVAEQRETNEGLRARNAALEAEVRDLEGGSGAIEERARGDMGMMRDGEVFVHILPQNTQPPAGASLSAEAPPKPAATIRDRQRHRCTRGSSTPGGYGGWSTSCTRGCWPTPRCCSISSTWTTRASRACGGTCSPCCPW